MFCFMRGRVAFLSKNLDIFISVSFLSCFCCPSSTHAHITDYSPFLCFRLHLCEKQLPPEQEVSVRQRQEG